MEKTIIERFRSVPDRNIREALLRNARWYCFDEVVKDLPNAISWWFCWYESPEWDRYWRNIRDKLRDWEMILIKPLSYDL